jgi:hypothetical protein
MDFIFREFIPQNSEKIDGVILTGSWSGQKSSISHDSILLKGVMETINYLEKFNIKTIVIGETERYLIPYTTIAARNVEGNSSSVSTYLDPSSYAIDDYLRDNLGLKYIPVINKEYFPQLSKNNEPYMSDTHHVTKYGADLILEKVFANPIARDFFAE